MNMMNITKRGFIKLGTSLIAGVSVARFSEIIIDVKPLHEWIEDRGDFYIVRIPDFKTFSKEILDKPTMLLFGEQSTASDITCNGFVNIYMPNGGTFTDSLVDTSKSMMAGRNAPVNYKGEYGTMSNININVHATLSPSNPYFFEITT